MPQFRYESIGGGTLGGGEGGGARSSVIEAPNRTMALRELVERGESPTTLEEIRGGRAARGMRSGKARGASSGLSFGRVMSRTEMASFIRELAIAVRAGLPLVTALRTIAKQGRTDRQKVMLAHLIGEVEHGKSLSEAMRAFGKPFDDLVVNMVNAGEMSGRLGDVLDQSAKLLGRNLKLRNSVVNALIYPAIIAFVVVVAIILVVTIIVPQVLKSVSGSLSVLPWPTQVLQGTAVFFSDWWWAILLGLAGALWVWTRLYRQPGFRLGFDGMLLRLPVAGVMLRDVAVARFTRTFGTLAEAGLPVLTALRITRRTLGNKALEAAIESVSERVSAGRTIADELESTGQFPALLVQVVGLGERTGRLDEMLMQAADAFEEKTENSIKVFTTVLPPVLVLCLTAVVAFVIISILLPLIEMQEAIG